MTTTLASVESADGGLTFEAADRSAPRSTRGEGLMAAAIHTHVVEARMTVRVSQTASGDLAAGARAQLERVDGVAVDDLSIVGLQPGLNDTTVEAVATLSLRHGDQPGECAAENVADRLADGFGVEPERVERVEPPG